MRLNYYDVAEAIRERVKPFKEKALMQWEFFSSSYSL
jgi:hypothetical protein